jgi:hypothetical protein
MTVLPVIILYRTLDPMLSVVVVWLASPWNHSTCIWWVSWQHALCLRCNANTRDTYMCRGYLVLVRLLGHVTIYRRYYRDDTTDDRLTTWSACISSTRTATRAYTITSFNTFIIGCRGCHWHIRTGHSRIYGRTKCRSRWLSWPFHVC